VLLIFGGGVVILLWCGLMVWVARMAHELGRSAFWGLGAGVAGVLGMITGIMLLQSLVDRDDLSTATLVATMLLPPTSMIVPMVVVGLVLRRAPIRVSMRGTWPVTFMAQGPGSITITGATVQVAWKNTTRELAPADPLRAEADGECVRITVGDEQLVAMPMGKPATPAGRRHQSLLLARRLCRRA
jgi:hypothetical protein